MARTMLYRRGGEPNPQVWDERIETLVVDDDAIEAAQKDGWSRLRELPAQDAPAEKPAKGKKAAE